MRRHLLALIAACALGGAVLASPAGADPIHAKNAAQVHALCGTQVVNVVVNEMGSAYPELKNNYDAVVRVVRSEEERFDAVLTAGLPRLEEALDRAVATKQVMSGDEAFRLYDSLGVPLDFMEDLASQRNITIVGAGQTLCIMTYAPALVWKKSEEARALLDAVVGSITFR